MGDMADYFQEQDEARLEDGVGFDDEPTNTGVSLPTTGMPDVTYHLVEPSQEELEVDKILGKLEMDAVEYALKEGGYYLDKRNRTEALSAINSLTLKQVMSLIPKKIKLGDKVHHSNGSYTHYVGADAVFGYNQAIDQMTESAERIWKS